METLKVYWLAIKYWAGGTSWEQAHRAAVTILCWNKKPGKDRRTD